MFGVNKSIEYVCHLGAKLYKTFFGVLQLPGRVTDVSNAKIWNGGIDISLEFELG